MIDYKENCLICDAKLERQFVDQRMAHKQRSDHFICKTGDPKYISESHFDVSFYKQDERHFVFCMKVDVYNISISGRPDSHYDGKRLVITAPAHPGWSYHDVLIEDDFSSVEVFKSLRTLEAVQNYLLAS